MDSVLTEIQEKPKRTPAPSDGLRIPVDAEHGGIRMAGCLILIVTFIISYVVITALFLRDDVFNIIALVAGLLIAAAVQFVADRYMKARWKSGRFIEFQNDQVGITQSSDLHEVIDLTQHVNVLMWYFKVPRQTRVPKGWYVVAFDLEQEDVHIPAYTFVHPDKFQDLPLVGEYVALMRQKDLQNEKEKVGFRMAGQQKRLHEGERQRQFHGAEMTNEHFNQYVNHLIEFYPQWLPVTS